MLHDGEYLFHEGDTARYFYIVRSGQIFITKYAMSGRVLSLRLASRGSLIGEHGSHGLRCGGSSGLHGRFCSRGSCLLCRLGGFLGGLLRCLLCGLLLGLPLELGLPFFLGLLFLCGFRFGGKPLFFCLLIFFKTGFTGYSAFQY